MAVTAKSTKVLASAKRQVQGTRMISHRKHMESIGLVTITMITNGKHRKYLLKTILSEQL